MKQNLLTKVLLLCALIDEDADKDNEGFFNDASQWFGSDSEDEEDW